ncbi:ATP-binding protein [bacterium]|nr:ATP-binding protein [bacterium]
MSLPELFIKIPSSSKILHKLREQIRKFAASLKLSNIQIDNVELAVDEAVSNVIRHAYPRRSDGLIQVRAWQDLGKLVVAVRDYGKGYTPKPVNLATIRKVREELSRGGMGRYLMKQCMDSVQYISLPYQYNETRMIIKISPQVINRPKEYPDFSPGLPEYSALQ